MKIYLIVNILSLFILNNSYCHHKIYSPRVEEGRQSLEWRGHFDLDDRPSKNLAHHHVLETEYSWTNFWQSELEFHISDLESTPLDWEKTEFQNQVQIIDKDYFAAALYFSYNFVTKDEGIDEIEYKYLNELKNKDLKLISNFIFEKKVGKNSSGSTEFTVSNYLQFLNPLYKEFLFQLLDFLNLERFQTFQHFINKSTSMDFKLQKIYI